MDKSELQKELSKMDLKGQIKNIGNLNCFFQPIFVSKESFDLWKIEPGFYLFIRVIFKEPNTSTNQLYNPLYKVRIDRTSKGFELKGKGVKKMKEQRGEEFYQHIENQVQKNKLRLLFLFPQIQEFI